jgi:hypothetical protein
VVLLVDDHGGGLEGREAEQGCSWLLGGHRAALNVGQFGGAAACLGRLGVPSSVRRCGTHVARFGASLFAPAGSVMRVMAEPFCAICIQPWECTALCGARGATFNQALCFGDCSQTG